MSHTATLPVPIVPTDANLVSLLQLRAQQQPDATGYTFLPSGQGEAQDITYAELDRRAMQLGAYLQRRQVPAGDPVMLLFHPGIDYICAFFGCLYAGAIAVPAYPPTHVRQFGRLQAIIDDGAAGFALTGRSELESIQAMGARGKPLSIAQWLVLEDAPGDAGSWTEPTLDASSIAFLQYTSGSTGTPKGVMVSHGNVLWNTHLIAEATGLTGEDTMVFWLPPYHDFGLIGGILTPLTLGSRCVLMKPSSFLLNPLRWLKAISDYRGTVTGAPNFAFDLCLRSLSEEQRAGLDLSSLRVVFNGAEPIRQSTLDRFAETFAPSGFRAEAWLAAYGLAEVTLMVSGRWGGAAQGLPSSLWFSQAALRDEHRALELDGPGQADEARCLVGTGRPLAHHQLAIVDPVTCQRRSEGEVGEIWVSGPCVAQGYWRREEVTRATFQAVIDGEEHIAARYLRTGDLGFLNQGQLYICGRDKDLIIINGQNIYPQDVELAAFSSHPALRVDGAVAFAVEVDGVERLTVVQELDFGKSADKTIEGVLAAAVASDIGLAPDRIVLVKAGRIPRTSSGKVRRRQCRQDLLDDSLPIVRSWERPRAEAAACEPSTEQPVPRATVSAAGIENWLRAQLAARTGIDALAIDPTQPFALYGLDSMASVQLAEALSAWLQLPVTPIVFWDHPSIGALAGHLAARTGEGVAVAQARPGNERHEPIAIVGLSCRLPGADDEHAFWQLLEQGRDAIRQVPEARLQAQTFELAPGNLPATQWAGFLDEVDRFDARFFGIAPMEAERMDPQQRLLLETAWHALEDAGIAPAGLAGSAAGVFVGIATHDYESYQAQAEDGLNVYAATGSAASIAANRLSYFLDLHGPSLAIDSACSSSAVAVHMACQSLRQGEATLALVGGVNLILSSASGQPFAQAGMLSPDGRCRVFDADANGYVRGEGCGVLVLKRLSEALRDGDAIRAVIAGSAVMQDGRSNGLVAPNGQAQAMVIRRALAQAGIEPEQVSYVEAHGTGTVLGDPIELNALRQVFAGGACAVGSVKAQIGHLEAAAGIAGLIKTVLMLEWQTIPAQQQYHTPNPHCRLDDSGLVIPTGHQPWPQPSAGRRHAGVSSFGFGGTLAHVVLAEAPAPAVAQTPVMEAPARHDPQLLLLSAKDEAALAASSRQLADWLRKHPQLALADAAHGLRHARQSMAWRRVLVCADREEAIVMLEAPASATRLLRPVVPAVAFLFPGQGTQRLRMGQALYRASESFRTLIDDTAQRLREATGVDVLGALYPHDPAGDGHAADALQETALAQPALFVIEYALARLLVDAGVSPAAMLGHSLGEYVAATLAGVFTLDDALALVAERGALMQAQPGGAMLAVAMTEAALQPWLGESLSLAAINAPERCVVAGPEPAIAELEQRLASQNLSCRRLAVSHAFHSVMMEPALPAFAERLATISLRAPQLPFVSNVTGTWITAAEATDPAYWVRHLRAPVRFADGLATLLATPDLHVLELGPGQALSELTKLQGGPVPQSWPALGRDAAGSGALSAWLRLLGGLWSEGQRIEWRVLDGATPRRRSTLPAYPFQRERHWVARRTVPARADAHAAAPMLSVDAGPITSFVETDSMASHQAGVDPRQDEIEASLRGFVAPLLHSRLEQVDPRAPLLELGADSLVLVQAIREIERSYGVTLSVRQLFEELTTIESIAAYLHAQLPASASAPAPAPVPSAAAGTALAQFTAAAPPVAARISVVPLPTALASLPPPAAEGMLPDVTSALERVIGQQLALVERLALEQLASLRGITAATLLSPVGQSTSAAAPSVPPVLPAQVVPTPSTAAANRPFAPYQAAAVTVHSDAHGAPTPSTPQVTPAALRANVAAARTTTAGAQAFAAPATIHDAAPETPPGQASKPLHFSLSFFGHYEANYDASKYDLLLAAARYADSHGFHALWVPERHFHAFGGLSPNPAVLAAALARETHSIQLRAGSVVLPLHHPIRVAEEWSVVDNLAKGRVGIACASGWHPNDFVFAPETYGQHRELMFERLAQVQSLWRGEAMRARDGAGKEIDVRLYPMPLQAELPVWITIVGNPDTYRRAGEVGAGVLTNLMGQSVEELEQNIGLYREALAAHGHDPAVGRVTVLLHTLLGEDLAQTRTQAREPFIQYLASSIGLFQNMARSLGMNVDIQALSEQDRTYLMGAAYERYVASSALIGTPQSCLPIVRRLREIGVDEIGCFIDFGVEASAVLAALPQLEALKTLCTDDPAGSPAGSPVEAPGQGVGLTEAQQGMWFECQLDEEAALSYNFTTVVSLRGALDASALNRSLAQVEARHTALRTVFDTEGTLQRVLPAGRLTLTQVEILDQGAGLEAAVEAWLAANNRQRMDLKRGPLMRADLLCLGPDEHRLALSFHHLIMDGLSQELLLQELAECYSAQLQERPPALPEAVPFDAYVAEQQAYMHSAKFAGDEAYWLGRFAGELPPPALPPGSGQVRGRQSTRARLHRVVLDGERYAQVRALSQRLGATLTMTVCASLAVLLHRLTGQNDLVIGMPMIAGRAQTGGANLLGYTLNLMPVRCEWSGQPGFADYLASIRQRLIEAYTHADYPFSQLLHKRNLSPDARRRPLAPVLFNLNRALALPQFHGLDCELLSGRIDFSPHELMISAIQLPDRLNLTFQYREDLFQHADIERLAERYVALLDAICAEPLRQLAELPLLFEAERALILETFAATETCVPSAGLIHERIAAQARHTPDAIAVTDEVMSLSYGELERRANGLAQQLAGHGAGPEMLVGLCLERGADMLVALLAILKTGAAYLPLDPAYPAERLAWMLGDAQPRLVVTQRALASRLDTPAVLLCMDEGLPPRADAFLPSSAPTLRSLAYVLYTSGSTGKPKGVMIEHDQLRHFADAMSRQLALDPRDVVLATTTLSFDIAVVEIFLPLLQGARVVIASQQSVVDPAQLHALLKRHDVSVLQSTPTGWRMLLDHAPLPHPLKALCGGEALSADLLSRLRAQAGEVWNLYGPTEATVWATAEQFAPDAGPITLGRPLANTRVYVLDAARQPVPIGVPGELYLGGAQVARGYLKRAELTAERFLPDPFAAMAGARMYRTGDFARWLPDGRVEYLGRIDAQVKLRGFRIEPGEIEAALKSCAGVRDALVLVREDVPGDQRLVAYCQHPGPLDTTALRSALQAVLPDYMVPTAYVHLTSFPLTPNGKLDRQALPEPAEEAYARPRYEPPQGELEEVLATIWASLLGVEQVGRHDNFFSLGGYSILAIRMLSKLRESLGYELPVRVVFEAHSLAAFAAVCKGRGDQRRRLIRMAGPAESLQPLFFVHHLGPHLGKYEPLAKALGERFAVHGLYRCPDWWQEEGDALVSLASYHADTIKMQQPNGPYRILGWSTGARIALAIAGELERRGEALSYVGLVDVQLPEASGYMEPWWNRDDGVPERLRQAIPPAILESLLQGDESGTEQGVTAMAPYVRHLGLPENELQTLRFMYEEFIVEKKQHSRIVQSRPLALNAPLHLCWASQEENKEQVGAYDWSLLTRQPGACIHDVVEGNHMTVMKEPCVTELAQVILAVQDRQAGS